MAPLYVQYIRILSDDISSYQNEINISTMKLITAVNHDEKTAKKRVDKKLVE